jgi:hypothetical protein
VTLRKEVRPAALGETYQFAHGVLLLLALLGMFALFPVALLALVTHIETTPVATCPLHAPIEVHDDVNIVPRVDGFHSLHAVGPDSILDVEVREVCIRTSPYEYPCVRSFE